MLTSHVSELGTSIDAVVREYCAKGDFKAAAGAALAEYGKKIRAWCTAIVRGEEHACDAYSLFCERLFMGLPNFSWKCSLSTWMYIVARRCVLDVQRVRCRHRARFWAIDAEVDDADVDMDEHKTEPWQTTDVKTRFAMIRDRLSSSDKVLLTLRVDRCMSWEDVALVTWPDASPDELRKHAVALRRKFHRLKQRIRTMAEADGLLAAGDSAS